MSWAALASNQCVSCNNLQDAVDTSVFTLKSTIPSSTKEITRSEAESYVYITPITSKTTNQLVVKSDLVAASYTSVGRYRSGTSVSCTTGGTNQFIYLNSTDYATYVSNGNLLSTGMILFSSSTGTSWNTSSYPQVYDISNLVVWNVVSGVLDSINQYC
jgi:hypothetical protein